MKKIWIICLMAAATQLQAQNAIERVLQSVAANNKELQAGVQLNKAQKLEARIGNTLPDPTVSYERMYGNSQELGKTGELTVAQSFDFPTVYGYKNKISRFRSELYDWQQADLRQQVLLKAKEICLDIIMLNRQKTILDTRYVQAQQLSALYTSRLKNGESTVLEANKIDLEMMNVKTEARLNEAALSTRMRELTALNGNQPVEFNETEFPATAALADFVLLQNESLAASPLLNSLRSEQQATRKQIGLNRAEWLPKLSAGYRYNTGPGEQFHGFLVGVSIPLYENRHKVGQAKAQALYSELKTASMTLQAETELNALYTEARALKVSVDEYEKLLKNNNNLELLMKALQAGQISMIEYFVEASTFYQSIQTALQLQNQYQKILAQLTRYRL